MKVVKKTKDDYLKIFREGSFLWPKAYMINYNRVNACFDDMFLVENKEVKVHKVKIYYKSNEFILGLQFTYITSQGEIIEGYKMKYYPNTDEKELILENNEYIVKVWGKCLCAIHEIGFETNLGRSLHHRGGGKIENPFSITAPEGYHFSIFAGSCAEELTNLTADISPFFGKKYPIINYNLLEHKNIIRLSMDFLTIKENTLFFLLNKQYSKLRFDHYILSNLWTRMIYSCHNQLRKYIRETIKSINDENILKDIERLQEILKLSKNKIQDPYGKNNFKGWQVEGDISFEKSGGQRGRSGCFVTSHQKSFMRTKLILSECYSDEEIRFLNEGLNFLVMGCFFSKGSGNTMAGFSVQILDEKSNIIWEQNWEKKNKNLQSEFEKVCFEYKREKSSKDKLPQSIIIQIAGRDNKFWNGYFGPCISGCFFRMLPCDSVFEKFCQLSESTNESLFINNTDSYFYTYYENIND